MLFLWAILGLLAAVAILLPLPLNVTSELSWPGFSEAQVRLGPVTLSRSHRVGPQMPTRLLRSAKGGGARLPVRPGPARMARPMQAFFAALGQIPVSQARLRVEGGVGDPAATAVLYGAAWSLLGGAAAMAAYPGRLEIVPRLEGPATGRLDASADVTVTPWRLLVAGLRAVLALRRKA